MKSLILWVSNLSKRFRFLQGMAIGLAASSFLAYASVTLTSFTSGTTISSADVNANFTNLKVAVDSLQTGIVTTWPTSSGTNVFTCDVSTTTTWTTADIIIDTLDSTSFNSTTRVFTIPSSGVYEIVSRFPGTGDSGMTYFDARLNINSGGSYPPVNANSTLLKRFVAGDTLLLEVGCNTDAANNTFTITEADFIFIIKKI